MYLIMLILFLAKAMMFSSLDKKIEISFLLVLKEIGQFQHGISKPSILQPYSNMSIKNGSVNFSD